MSRHTKGPWYVRDTTKGPYICAGEGTIAEVAIAKVLTASRPTEVAGLLDRHVRIQANAALLAAAPELRNFLAEACGMLKLLDPHSRRESVTDFLDRVEELKKVLDA